MCNTLARVARSMVWALGLVLPACHVYLPVVVEVRDAETQQVIPRARVTARYRTMLTPRDILFQGRDLRESTATTDERGRAVVELSNVEVYSRGIEGAAANYLEGGVAVSDQQYSSLWSRNEREGTAREPDLILNLYRVPHPTILLVVPDKYRGFLLLEEYLGGEPIMLKQGERVVELSIQPPGPTPLPSVQLGPQHRVDDYHIRARYLDGTIIPGFPFEIRDATPFQTLLHYIGRDGVRRVFFIGTGFERNMAVSKLANYPRYIEELWKTPPQPK